MSDTIIPDTEIKDINKDLLDFRRYVNALYNIITNSETQFTIGLFGSWGKGKTSIMNMLKERIYKEGFDKKGNIKDTSDQTKLYIPIWFDAWMYERESNLLTPFLDNFRYQMNDMFSKIENKNLPGLSKRIGKVIFKLLKATSVELGVGGSKVTFDSGKFVENLKDKKEEYQSVYFQSIQEIQQIFKEFTKILGKKDVLFVFFIDDLDRCLPEKALHVLEIVKNLIFIKGYFFVVGLDPKVIENYIDYKYKELSTEDNPYPVKGADYIKKIFQVEFVIPPITQENANKFMENILIRLGMDHESNKDLVSYLTIDSEINPREIKRFINQIILYGFIKEYKHSRDFLAIQIFRFRTDWKSFHQHLKEKGEKGAIFLRETCNSLTTNYEELSDELRKVMEIIKKSPMLKKYLNENRDFFSNIKDDDFIKYFYLTEK